jgi:hypothetical protein
MMYMNSATFRTPKKASLSEERSTSLKMFIARFPFFPSRTEVIEPARHCLVDRHGIA